MDVILWYSLWFRRFEIKQGRQLRAKKMDGQSRQSSPVKDAQRPGRRAASDFPSLLTVRSSAQNARSDSKTLPLFRSWPSDFAFSQVTL